MVEKIKRWYSQGLWTAKMVHDALEKGILTQIEYEIIIGGKRK